MSVHLLREIENLKKSILTLGATVEERLREAVSSVINRNRERAGKVIQSDGDIDRNEVKIEEDCLKILALHQPVAVDLRFIVAILKINNDLERIGDLAANIAKRAVYLTSEPITCGQFHIPEMSEKVQSMLSRSLDSLVNSDADMAHGVCISDDEVDDLLRDTYKMVWERVQSDIDTLKCASHHLDVSRALERIADLTTNIAEDVIYMIEGQIIRHPTTLSGMDSDPEETHGRQSDR
jgi:phosphate transport system protein